MIGWLIIGCVVGVIAWICRHWLAELWESICYALTRGDE